MYEIYLTCNREDRKKNVDESLFDMYWNTNQQTTHRKMPLKLTFAFLSLLHI
jgi:hypothetical protein